MNRLQRCHPDFRDVHLELRGEAVERCLGDTRIGASDERNPQTEHAPQAVDDLRPQCDVLLQAGRQIARRGCHRPLDGYHGRHGGGTLRGHAGSRLLVELDTRSSSQP